MLRTGLMHPEILRVLASAGHGSLVLISDANFPSATAPNPRAPRVFLNLRPGIVAAADILAALTPVLVIERAMLMEPDDGREAPVHVELLRLLCPETEVARLSRTEFYEATRSDDLALVIVSGDERWYANLLIAIGSVPESAGLPSFDVPGQLAGSTTNGVTGGL